MTTDAKRAQEQAQAQLEGIVEMVRALEDEEGREDAVQTIHEDPLSVQVRSGWYTPGERPEAEEFEILLCTGGPACRIIGELGQYSEPKSARLQYQDWFTPWTEYITIGDEHQALLTYAQQFYFGA